ncbi:MAG: SpoIID/LytB domain-containing protein [Candidatus Woesebacteria bacterium]|nr:SpoIID/LytB domain-containing protein [Candidatus Woesebacteria bacterium]
MRNLQFSLNFQNFKKVKYIIIGILILFGVCFLGFGALVNAEIDCQNTNPSGFSAGDAQFCADQLQNLINLYLPAQTTNKKNLSALQSQLNDINKRVTALTKQIQILSANIIKREEDMAYTKEIFNQKAKDQYTFLRLYDPITPFLFADSASQAFQEITLRQRAADADRITLGRYADDLIKLKNDEDALQKSKDSLAASQKQVAAQTSSLAAEVAKVDAYLASLSAKQQAFIEAKLESLGLSRSAYNMKGGCSSDINPFKSPGFSPAFAFFTYGVPNRVGMNQFGAKGRAEAGQSAQTILSAYYNADLSTGYNQSINIRVVGTNEFGQSFNDTWNIDDYLKHLYEMPTDFPMEALKAQAIAARSYALSYTNNGGGSICPSQQCQVVKKELNNGTWQQAVDATRGMVLTNGGSPIKAWFSSTHGGYAYTSADIGWSATAWTKRLSDSTGGVGSFGDLANNAYDKSSPVFYCDWGSRSAYNKTAWLKPDELADIVNAVLLAKKDGSTKSHLYQPDKANPEGTDTWDASRVKSELSSRGGTPLDSVNDISVGVDFGTGRTTTVTVNGQAISGDDFKNYFNLRAPANIQIVGPLYNIEKR